MADRIVRGNILTSDAVNALSWPAEVFYRRLMSIVDDFGRYDARPSVLRGLLYSLKLEKVSEADIVKWKAECAKAGLVSFYQVDDKEYLEILKFGQRLRAMKSRWPENPAAVKCPQMSADDSRFPQTAAYTDTESETESETETEESEAGKPPPPSNKSFESRKKKFGEDLVPYVKTYGKEMIRDFYDYWREPNKSKTKMRWEQERTWDLKLRLNKWEANEYRFKKKGGKENDQPAGSDVNDKILKAIKKVSEVQS